MSEKLNETRLTRVHQVLSTEQSALFGTVAILFQYNLHYLPGFHHADTPAGIALYQPTTTEHSLYQQFSWPIPIHKMTDNWAFEGIYAMGSTASFGQNPKSDVDIWLVHHQDLTTDQLNAIEQKSQLITQWFASVGFEVNFYLIHPKQFIETNYLSEQHSLGIEHSGSSQHWLLLEEFYRSHIRLAGKTVAWWPQACLTESSSNVLFLGDISALPASEYFGASLWQLYKSLQKPHKALLKVLLLETYTAQYPHNNLITQQIWQACLDDDFSASNDAYLFLYQRIENYLVTKRDVRRLEIVRRCFYLKCGIRLSDVNDNSSDWRTQTMRELVERWTWPDSLLLTLDNSPQWHSGQLKWFNQQLNELLLTSYRTLLKFASKHELSDTMRVEELGLLARKLHGYFSDDEHQLVSLNPLWSRQIAESQLTVIHSRKNKQFYLYREWAGKHRLIGESALANADNVCALMAWAAMNKIATAQTLWHELDRSKKRAQKLNGLSQQLVNLMAQKSPVSKRDLCQPCFFKKVIVVANLQHDPTVKWRGQEVMLDYMNATPLSLGVKQKNMLGDINIICLNSWGEWQSHQFNNDCGLLDAISYLAFGIKNAHHKIDISVISCSAKLNNHLEVQLKQVLVDCQSLVFQIGVTNTLMYPLQLGCDRFGLYFNSRGMVYKKLESQPFTKFKLVPQPQPQRMQSVLLSRPDLGDDPFSSMPSVILQFITAGAQQYFLRQRAQTLDVFLVDEQNQLTHTEHQDVTMTQLVAQKSREYVFQAETITDKHYFNMPQFFHLKRRKGELCVVPFGINEDEMGSVI
ncbi:class I adenylate cyclase [Shewanella intestini]|uniref:Adenylate cyclase n=1 Tax=Shewanella intestini TaxID=2017544 RepID=A0ABS5I8I7_9GAMM|nr:class I adenylate cyclase [Shewanella intestini]